AKSSRRSCARAKSGCARRLNPNKIATASMSESSARRPARVRAGPLQPPATPAGFIVAVLAVAFIAFFACRALPAREVAAGRVTRTPDSIQRLADRGDMDREMWA